MAINPNAARSPVMRCRICGHGAPRGAKLCMQCKAAVKRARQVPTIVSQLMPMPMPRMTSPARVVAPQRAIRVPSGHGPALAPFPGGWGAVAALIAFGAAVCLTGYLVIEKSEGDARGVARSARAAVARDRSVPGAVPEPQTTIAMPAEEVPMDGAALRHTEAVPSAPVNLSPQPASRRSSGDARTAGSGKASKASDARGTGEIAAGADYEMVASDEARSPAPAAPMTVAAVQESAPDRWQLLNGALARCAKGGFLVSVICEERERWRYCDGFWGEVPQCPGGVRIDYRR